MSAHTLDSSGRSRLSLLAALCCVASGGARGSELVIPSIEPAEKRDVTVDDVVVVRDVGSLSVSPDGSRFAIFVRQADPLTNEYRTAWYAGTTEGDTLIRIGGGGTVGPRVMWTGHMPGEIAASDSHWSPDGQWIAYTLRRNGEVQLWRSRLDGGLQEQLTHNAADVRALAWSEDGRTLYFSVGSARTELQARERARDWEGYRYDEDLWGFGDFLGPGLIRPLETDLSVWRVTLDDRKEQPGSEIDRAAFEGLQARRAEKVIRLNEPPLACVAPECSGTIRKVWWSEDTRRVLFWRSEGVNNAASGFYSWDPGKQKLAVITRARDEELRLCAPAKGDRVICVRESAERPAHVVAIDLRSGRTQVVAEVNPEFRNLRLGKVERIEWDTPRFQWNEPGGALAGMYPGRAYGYIIYPPGFDPSKKYPLFIDPYMARGFEPLGAEHALHAYAAKGIVVLRAETPMVAARLANGRSVGMKQMYSAELGFPHLTMLMESTVRALDSVVARGFIDDKRVGIGGVSHGTFVPLYMMQKHDRIAAISISSPNWGPMQHYGYTQKAAREMAVLRSSADNDWMPSAEGERQELLRQIDIADHVDTIEAPILMHLAAQETFAMVRLLRHLADEKKPYDAYVFAGETHIKWQPAHLQAIMRRNLDWFRFWLQDYADPARASSDEYLRWRALKRGRLQASESPPSAARSSR
jgi:dipeptidyl aminopeptidase/acylaminoacyl peptidase